LRPNEVVIWDRLGKAGRCKNPSKQHYNPGVKRLIEEKHCQIMFLPPKGKLFNPIELMFGTLKTHLRNRYTTSVACLEQRARTETELRIDLEYATSQIERTQLEGFFRERGTERAFRALYSHIELS
jgi:transposase